MSDNDELVRELQEARLRLSKAKKVEAQAHSNWLDKKSMRLKAADAIEKILVQIETGKTGLPLVDQHIDAVEERRQKVDAEIQTPRPPRRKKAEPGPS